MATNNNQKPSPEAIESAQKNWVNFIKFSTVSGIAIAVLLILMAVTLV
jgi:hypothetical protein